MIRRRFYDCIRHPVSEILDLNSKAFQVHIGFNLDRGSYGIRLKSVSRWQFHRSDINSIEKVCHKLTVKIMILRIGLVLYDENLTKQIRHDEQ